MIISHKHKFIFIKTRKTAGTSLEITLSGICGPEDIITTISPEDQKTRKRLGYYGPQNIFIDKKHYSVKDHIKIWVKNKPAFFYNHMTASKIKSYIDPEIWNGYYKFCFVRHPYDRMVSLYYWRTRNDSEAQGISQWLHNNINQIMGPKLYVNDNGIMVDDVYKYENMESSLIQISQILKLEKPIQLPHKKSKSGLRKDTRHFNDILKQADKDLIYSRFKFEFEQFNYQR